MQTTTRRTFMMQVAVGGSVLTGASAALAQTPPLVNEKDAQPAALGYAADTTKVDKKKFAKHTADQKCSNCQLYTGKPKDTSGPCSLFPGKHVTANGWCSAWVKKAG
jgi:hypothetical protein